MASKYDVIVVGAGPGGITCAALLQKWGLKTLLLDQNKTTGGKAVNVERDGFKYELAPKLQCPMYGSGFEQAYNLLGMGDIRVAPLDEICLSYRSSSSSEYTTAIIKQTGQDPTALFDMWELNEKERGSALNVLGGIALMPPEQIAALDDMTFQEYIEQQPDVPNAVYSYFAMHSNCSLAEPVDLVSASEQVTILQQIVLSGGGGYYMDGFARVLVELTDAFKANGGEVRIETRVEKIEVKDGRVTGASTKKGEFEAPIVISDAGLQPTVLKLVGENQFDKSYVNYVKGLVPGWAFTAVKYFFNKPVLKHKAYMMWSDDSWWNMERFLKVRAGHVPDEVVLFGIVPCNYDPTLAPAGKQCFIAGTICPPDPEEQQIQMLYGKMDEMLRKIHPGVLDALETKEFEGPAEVSAATRDKVLPGGQGGECVGLAQIVGQCGKYKPSPQAPIHGLFYVGCDAGAAGMGTHQAAMSGINVARMVFRHHRKGQAAT